MAADGPEYLFFDEIQFTRDWQTWLKHQVDFEKRRRIAVTGSATPLVEEGQESGVGRWHTIKLATLSFFEYLQIKKLPVPPLPELDSLLKLFEWTPAQFARVSEEARPLVAHFHEYLLRGGFPQCALVPSVDLAQKLLRDDIVDKVLKRELKKFIDELRQGDRNDFPDLDAKVQVPFVRSVIEECSKGRELTAAQREQAIKTTLDMIERIRQEVRKVGFWKNEAMRELLTKALVRDLNKAAVCRPGGERDLAQRSVALAKENHENLSCQSGQATGWRGFLFDWSSRLLV